MSNIITVSMSDYVIDGGDSVLQTNGVGSCLVVCMYCAEKKIGGMAHSMLPDQKSCELNSDSQSEIHRAKFVDQAIDNMVREFAAQKISSESLTAKIVGGAKIFSIFNKVGGSIGERNIVAAREKLAEYNIKIAKEDVGGGCGRTILFHLKNGLIDVNVKI